MSALQEILDNKDVVKLLKVSMRARRRAGQGIFCKCSKPELFGKDLMCGHCLLENQAQRQKLEASLRKG